MSKALDRDEVSRRAYELFLSRGGEHGHDVEDWLRAEREVSGAGSAASAEGPVANPGDREAARTGRSSAAQEPSESAAGRGGARAPRARAAGKK